MRTPTNQTERVIDQHLSAFLEGRGVDAIVADYHDDAVFLTPQAVYRGKPAIREFFQGFLANLPAAARDDFQYGLRNGGALPGGPSSNALGSYRVFQLVGYQRELARCKPGPA